MKEVTQKMKKIAKSEISFTMSVRPSVRIELLSSPCTDFH
jgi:hypothetical protein